MQHYIYCNDALLAGAFARSNKMMRFIDSKYNKVIERSRKLKKRVVFFSGNSIEELLVKIGEDL